MKKQRKIVETILALAAATLSYSVAAAEPPAPEAPQPATTSASTNPDPVKPFFDIDPATKPKPIEINPRDLQTRQPASIKSAQ